jgi:hypothetical protein
MPLYGVGAVTDTTKTTIRSYFFDTRNANEKTAYAALARELKTRGSKCFRTHGRGSHYRAAFASGMVVELKTDHLFDNQWTTAPIPGVSEKGLRVFDWAEDALFNDVGRPDYQIRRGHYLDLTSEMREIRRNRNECGYCGHQEEAARGLVFCDRCIDSEYLKEKELYLTRMRAVDDTADRAPLTGAEKGYLLPLYREGRIRGVTVRGKARATQMRADILLTRDETIQRANDRFDGFTWLLDRGLDTSNVIFYSHTGRFEFGWRQPVDKETEAALLDVISEFNFPYDIKCEDGRTLSAD